MSLARKKRILQSIFLGVPLLLVAYYAGSLREQRVVGQRAVSAPEFENEFCRQAYLDLYRAPTLEVRVVFGYKDARPARFVADRYERLLFVQRILRPCAIPEEDRACGFARDPRDADLFVRSVPGPDGNFRNVRMRVVQPAVGPDDEENRKDPFQAWRTRYAERAFLDGLAEADIVFYNGHSRAGGGPDFRPPRITASRNIDFGWYQANEPGFEPVLDALRSLPANSGRPKLLGLLSCASTRHFLGRVNQIRPTLATLTSPRLLYFSDALETSLEALSAVLGMKCERAFDASLKKAETRAGGARVSGFFKSM